MIEPLTYSLKEAAAAVGLSERTIRRIALEDNELIAYLVRGKWRIRRDDLDEWVQKQPTDRAS